MKKQYLKLTFTLFQKFRADPNIKKKKKSIPIRFSKMAQITHSLLNK